MEAFDNFLESISEAKDERILKLMKSLGHWILAHETENYWSAHSYMEYTARNLKAMFQEYWWHNDEMEAAYEADAIRWYDSGAED